MATEGRFPREETGRSSYGTRRETVDAQALHTYPKSRTAGNGTWSADDFPPRAPDSVRSWLCAFINTVLL